MTAGTLAPGVTMPRTASAAAIASAAMAKSPSRFQAGFCVHATSNIPMKSARTPVAASRCAIRARRTPIEGAMSAPHASIVP